MFFKIFILSVLLCETFCALLFKNDQCNFNNQNGLCTRIEHCPLAIEGLKNGVVPKTCSFEGKDPIVCCVKQHYRKLHEEKCEEFLDEIHLKKLKNELTFVIGGTNAKAGEYPHMAMLGFGEKNNIQWNCGGSLISKTFILTAAHCLSSSTYGDVKYVRLGDIYVDGSYRPGQDFQVIQRIRHPEYKPPLVYNDIALLKLDKPVEFSKNIKPACLFSKNDLRNIPEITATGWGLTEYAGNPSNILQTVRLDIFSIRECNDTYKNQGRKIPYGILDDRQLCAGGRETERDTCQGDSGGPLQLRESGGDDLHKIIGVTSIGKQCGTAGVPAIYTRVAHYIPWIESIAFS